MGLRLKRLKVWDAGIWGGRSLGGLASVLWWGVHNQSEDSIFFSSSFSSWPAKRKRNKRQTQRWMSGPSWSADLACLKGQFIIFRGHVLRATPELCTVCLQQQTELLQGFSSLQALNYHCGRCSGHSGPNQTSTTGGGGQIPGRRAEGAIFQFLPEMFPSNVKGTNDSSDFCFFFISCFPSV